MESIFLYYLTLWKPLGYILVALGIITEGGGITVFTAAFLASNGFLNIFNIFLVTFFVMLLRDIFLYWVGTRLKKGKSWIAWLAKKMIQPIDKHLRERTFYTIFISKFIYGFNYIVITKAGLLGIHWKKIFKSDILAIFCWALVVGGLGYFLVFPLSILKQYIRFVEFSLLGGLVIFLIVGHYITRNYKKKLY